MKKRGILYLIASLEQGEDSIIRAVKAGVDIIQLREKNITSREYVRRAKLLKEWTKDVPTKLLINDRIDIALLSKADGVHVGQEDISADEARCVLGVSAIVGVTARTKEQAQQAERMGADYLGSGAWNLTATKQDAVPITPECFQEIADAVTIPVLAVGGITLENAMLPISCGASGLAVSAGILASNKIEDVIRLFQKRLSEAQ